MAKKDEQIAENLESSLLFLGREPKELAGTLLLCMGDSKIEDIVRSAGRKRSGNAPPPARLANLVIQQARMRKRIVRELLECLPKAPKLIKKAFEPPILLHLEPSAKLGRLRTLLTSSQEEDWQSAQSLATNWLEQILQQQAEHAAKDPPKTKGNGAATGKKKPKPKASTPSQKNLDQLDKHKERNQKLQGQLKSERKVKAQIQKDLSREKSQSERLRRERDEARTKVRSERERASTWKKRNQESSTPSDRELQLAQEAEEQDHARSLLARKLEIVEAERDDFRACLEDLERFLTLPGEEVPSFRNRPLTEKEYALGKKLNSAEEQGNSKFRILVVGGGEPQYRHLDKFKEYAKILGFKGTWRLAEYTSWHKEMDRLGRDMASRYDALVILHWNRTTFGRQARAICNQKGQKPCITCHYEGFTSLRESLQECLRQLLARPQQ